MSMQVSFYTPQPDGSTVPVMTLPLANGIPVKDDNIVLVHKDGNQDVFQVLGRTWEVEQGQDGSTATIKLGILMTHRQRVLAVNQNQNGLRSVKDESQA